MKLSVIVIFFNNRREAPRTLYTLSRAYQKNIEYLDYEALVIDSNSPEPLNAEMVKSFGSEFSYHFVKTAHPSPVEALRHGLELSKGEYVMIVIDGAHLLTPAIFSKWQSAVKAYPNSFVYTQRYHLGKYRQNDDREYGQSSEDLLLNSIDWKNDGYSLFKISHFRQADEWWFSKHFESSCFVILRKKLIEHGSIYKDYFSVGGGFLNMDIFKKAVEDIELTTVILMGESTFHQFHGGATTNVAREDMKQTLHNKEYFELNQKHYARSEALDVHYFGNIAESVRQLLIPSKIQVQYREIVKDLMLENKPEEAMFFIDRATTLFPYNITLISEKVRIYKQQGKYGEALNVLEKGLTINQSDLSMLLLKGEILIAQNKLETAIEVFEFCRKIDTSNPIPLMKLCKVHLKKRQKERADAYIKLAVEYVEELKTQDKFLHVFTFVKNHNYKSLARKMLDFSEEISTLAYNFKFKLGKIELLEKGEEKSRLTDELINLYYNSKNNVNQSNRLANLLIWQNKKDALWKLCDDLVQKNMTFYKHFFKAKWHLHHENLTACSNEIQHALPKALTIQNKAGSYIIQAKCELKQKHFRASLKSVDKAIEINPNNPDFLFIKAKAHLELQQYEQAKALFERIVSISNHNLKFNALLHLFDINFKQGNYKKCELYLVEAAKVKPNHKRTQRKQQKLAAARK